MLVCVKRQIFIFICRARFFASCTALRSRMTNELALLVVQTNASVTSRGTFARVEPALVILERSVSEVKDLARSTDFTCCKARITTQFARNFAAKPYKKFLVSGVPRNERNRVLEVHGTFSKKKLFFS